MKCNRCGGEVDLNRPEATKVWCSDRCYRLDKAVENRVFGQLGLEKFKGEA